MSDDQKDMSRNGDEDSPSGVKLFAFTAGALVLFVLLVLGLGEVVVRAAYGTAFRYYDNYRSRPMIFHERSYGRHFAHDFKDRLHNYQVYSTGAKKMPWTFTTNNHGWREPPVKLEKQDGFKRLMVLGSSATLGPGVDDEYVAPNVLRDGLRLDRSQQWEVLNRSVPGFHDWHYLEYMRADGFRWKPDVLVLGVTMAAFDPRSDKWFEKNVKAKESKPGAVLSFVRRFRFLNLLRIAFSQEFVDAKSQTQFLEGGKRKFTREDWGAFGKDKYWYARGYFDTEKKKADAQLATRMTQERYSALAEECRKRGIRLVVAILPISLQISERYWVGFEPPDAEMGKIMLQAPMIRDFAIWLDTKDIPYVNILENFRSDASREPLYFDGGHFTERGSAIIARAIARKLSEDGLINLRAEPFWGL